MLCKYTPFHVNPMSILVLVMISKYLVIMLNFQDDGNWF